MDTEEPKVVTPTVFRALETNRNSAVNPLPELNFSVKEGLRSRWHGSCFLRHQGAERMRGATDSAAGRMLARFPRPTAVTLLELVNAVCEVTDDEAEVVATVHHMLETGHVRLCGSFRGVDPREFR